MSLWKRRNWKIETTAWWSYGAEISIMWICTDLFLFHHSVRLIVLSSSPDFSDSAQSHRSTLIYHYSLDDFNPTSSESTRPFHYCLKQSDWFWNSIAMDKFDEFRWSTDQTLVLVSFSIHFNIPLRFTLFYYLL